MRRDTAAMLRGFDAQTRGTVGGLPPRLLRAPVSAVRPMGIKAALEWAFGVECVSLDLDNAPEWHCGTDTLWRLARQKELGCRVDGGGRSAAHADAEVIASFVAALPRSLGGAGMAVRIAQLARAGITPDPLIDVPVRCVPLHPAQGNQHGPRARAEDVPGDLAAAWDRPVCRGRPARPPMWCRVTFTPTAAQIGAARRGWLDWWGALLHIGHDLRTCGRLDSIAVTQDMPVMTPWRGSPAADMAETVQQGGARGT